MKLKQRILFIPVFILLIYGIYTTVIKIQANRHRRAEILAQIAADELKYNQEWTTRTCCNDPGFVSKVLKGKIITWLNINKCSQKYEFISKTNSQTEAKY